MSINTKSNEKKLVKLAELNLVSSRYLSEQHLIRFGSNRKSEITGMIGNDGKSWEELYNNYLDTA